MPRQPCIVHFVWYTQSQIIPPKKNADVVDDNDDVDDGNVVVAGVVELYLDVEDLPVVAVIVVVDVEDLRVEPTVVLETSGRSTGKLYIGYILCNQDLQKCNLYLHVN